MDNMCYLNTRRFIIYKYAQKNRLRRMPKAIFLLFALGVLLA